jgi:PRTRC genetic system ThiF family protein
MAKQSLDLSFTKVATLMLPATETWNFVLVGCGGTGSWLAPSVARIARVLQEQGKAANLWFVDPDTVEEKNIPRQNFCQAELGQHKAATLAGRLSAAWGVDIRVSRERFSPAKISGSHWIGWDSLTVVIGCVDNAAGRKELAKALQYNRAGSPHRAWWLDCGNAEHSGQVLFGSAANRSQLDGAMVSGKICRALPAPSLVAPDLLKARPEESGRNNLSCAEMQLANAQSLAVNQMVASVATDYLLRIVFGGLKRFGTYFNLESGSMRSLYCTAEEIVKFAKRRATAEPQAV